MNYCDDSGRTINPLDDLKVSLALRRRQKLPHADGRSGVPELDVALWISNMTVRSDVIKIKDIDGIIISKYIKLLSYSRMMIRTLTDMELGGKTRAVCVM